MATYDDLDQFMYTQNPDSLGFGWTREVGGEGEGEHGGRASNPKKKETPLGKYGYFSGVLNKIYNEIHHTF